MEAIYIIKAGVDLTKEERYFGALGAGPRPKLNVS
jgi:hypothetical protein